MKTNILRILFLVSILSLSATMGAQSRFALTPGGYYQGGGFSDEVQGMGFMMGLEYYPGKTKRIFSVELRSRFGFYDYDDGTNWTEDRDGTPKPPRNPGPPSVKFRLFCPELGVVPKARWWVFEDELALFVETEFSAGLMTGRFGYYGEPTAIKSFTDFVASAKGGIGLEYVDEKGTLVASLGASSLNFSRSVRKHAPQKNIAGIREPYVGHIPKLFAAVCVNVTIRIPLRW
ncbi:MAG: hypothetical protein LBN29_07270 [Mediterranea sp.]|nr:hypothetical protein [Mediterranea sp.]